MVSCRSTSYWKPLTRSCFTLDQGTEFIRLDAIAYAWKEIGTACIHLP